MKRKILLLISVVSIFSALIAAPIERATALQYAKQFISQTPVPQFAPGKAYLPQVEKEPTYVAEDTATETPLYYIYNLSNDGGFVIVAADTRVRTIIGYSFNGSFDINKIPENMKWWLKNYEKQIQYAIDYLQDTTYPEIGSNNLSSSTIVVSPLLGTMAWNQNSPYNNQAPLINWQRAVTGCVATAMAQIMRYHQHPAQGVGNHSYTTRTHKLNLSANFGETQYDWGNMTYTYNSQSTPTQKSAVAQLMYHVGVAVEMDYTVNGSGAYSQDVPLALLNHFNYDIGIDVASRVFYTQEEWHNIIKDELNAQRPIYYSGTNSSNAGHAFVCDGYRSDDLFHINWGWGGSSNGYFSLDLLNPSQQGAGGSIGGFNQNQYIVTHIQVPQPDSKEAERMMGLSGGFSTSTDSVGRNELIQVKMNNYFNVSFRTMNNLRLAFGLYQNNELKYIIDQSFVGELDPDWGWFERNRSFSLSSTFQPGKYIMKPIFSLEADVWVSPLVNPEMINELDVEITAQSVFIGKRNYSIQVSANPTEGGTVDGGGSFVDGTSCTVTATANTGFVFKNWTENGAIVSTESSYTFTVETDRDLVANFIISNFRTKADGNWENPATWQYSSDKVTWENATTVPAADAASISVEHAITVNTPISNVNNLTIKSGATLIGDISGSTTVEQTAENHHTYYISSPVSGTNVGSTNIGFATTFTESGNSWLSPAVQFSSIVPVFGKGYGVQVGKDATGPTTISFTGTLNNGEQTILMTATERKFNFLGNPYPSYLSGAEIVKDANKVEKTVWTYFRDNDGKYKFGFFNINANEGTYMTSGNIPPMQGFWVKAKEQANFTFNNDMRIHKPAVSDVFRAPQASERQVLRLQVSNGTVSDEAVMLYSRNANSDWNSSKLMNPGLSIYTVKGAENLALNSRTAIEYDVETAVGIKAESGAYTFSVSKFENFGTDKVLLHDKVANVFTELSNGDSYTVNFTEAYEGTDRFALVIPRSGVVTDINGTIDASFFAFAKDNHITVNSNAQAGMIYVFNSVGHQVAAQAISGKLTTISTVLPAGVYLVKLNNLTTKVIVK